MDAVIIDKASGLQVRRIKDLKHIYADPDREMIKLAYYDELGNYQMYTARVSRSDPSFRVVFE